VRHSHNGMRRHIAYLPLVALLCAPGRLPADDDPAKLLEAGHYKRARPLIEARYRANPKDPETLYLMSQIKQVWKDLRTAEDLAEKALAADPKNPRYHLQMADVTGEDAGNASFLKQISLGRRFKKEVDTVVALDPKDTAAHVYLIQYYFMAPSIIGGDKNRARQIPDDIMKVDPVQGYRAKAMVARMDGHADQIEALCLKEVEAGPNNYQAHIELGNYYFNNGKFAEAEAQAGEGLRIDRGRVAAHSLLAASLAREKKWPELETALGQAEKDDPDNLMPYFRAGGACLGKDGDPARAERYLRKYLSQEPEPDMPPPAAGHRALGLALEKLGHKPEAISELQTAVKLDPNSKAKEDLKRLQ
jgi:tetratricopeptide (TPR) repeat protein